MEGRARSLADQAVESGESWIQRLGIPPASPARRERWIREVSTIAAYRDRWHLSGQNPVGKLGNTISIEQTSQRQRALAAADRATALSRVESNQVLELLVALRYKRTLTREEASSCEQAHECEGDGPMG